MERYCISNIDDIINKLSKEYAYKNFKEIQNIVDKYFTYLSAYPFNNHVVDNIYTLRIDISVKNDKYLFATQYNLQEIDKSIYIIKYALHKL